MLFQHVAIAGLAHIDAPRRLSSQEINMRLKPTLDRIGIRVDVLGDIAGVHSRYLWEEDVQASDVATLAGVKALADAAIDPARIGLLVNTSVSRDINGMDIASRMIERGEIDYALIVDGETANLAYEKTLERLAREDVTEEQFRNEMATLTLGSGAAAMVLARAELAPGAPRYKGGVTRAATEWNKLCRGNLDGMMTDTRLLLLEGIKLAQKTFGAARHALGWVVEELDQFVIHQVSKVHTKAFTRAIGIDPKKVMTIFGEHGNIGPASVPIVLSKLRERGSLKKGDRVALLGIGSGLNCSMAEVEW